MIRDPSDGSVRERRKIEVSALAPDPDQKQLQRRLEASREWLKAYKERKGQPNEPSITTTPEEISVQPSTRSDGH